jgi:RalA-binding protein 1
MNRRPSEDDSTCFNVLYPDLAADHLSAHPKRSQTDKARSRQDSQSSSIHSTTRSNSVPIHARNDSVETSRPASPPLPKAAEALNGLKGKVSPPPLVIPGRSDVDAIPSVSLSGATVDAQAPESTQPLQLPQYPNSQILTPASSTGTTGGPSPLSQFPLPPGNGNGFDPDNETRPHPSHNSVPSVGSFTTPQFLGANGSTTLAPAPHAASRESRIPLPDEAKLYIANMVDSPRPSPAANSESFDTDIHDDPRSAKTIQAPTRASDEDNVSSDADEESGIASGIDDTGSFDSHVSSADQLRTGAREDASQSATIRVPQRKSSLLRRNRRPAPNPPTAEVPSTHLSSISPSASALVDTTHASASAAHAGLSQGLHPSSAQSPYASQSSLQRDAADLSSTPDEIPRETSPSIDLTESITSEPPPPSYRTVSNANSSTSLPIDRDLTGVVVEKQSVQDADRKREKTPAGQPSFRELPLLASDLPHTTITVVNSTIKPNDRGKEVLSFIISVEPGNKKTGWKIEKLYSDVLTLDHRVRTTVGKTATKKIVTLPEGKLWKDHAPVRVDQRKVRIQSARFTLLPFLTIVMVRQRWKHI